MAKKKINELSGASRFIEKFFDGVRNNTAKRFIDRSAAKGVDSEVIKKMKEIDKNNKELEDLIRKYSK